MNIKTTTTIKSKEEYDQLFPSDVRKEALKNILDIRKFEIELYWKRATYFWAFIGATFAGYVTLSNSDTPNNKSLYAIILLGIVFSLCWYLVNRGSKYWQLNWEKHLDAIEDPEIGPLYKTTIARNYYKGRWYVLYGPYPFSVSKINILLSFFVLLLWMLFLIDFIYSNNTLFSINFGTNFSYYGYSSLLELIAIAGILVFGQTGKLKKDEFRTHINFDKRSISEEKSPEKGEANI